MWIKTMWHPASSELSRRTCSSFLAISTIFLSCRFCLIRVGRLIKHILLIPGSPQTQPPSCTPNLTNSQRNHLQCFKSITTFMKKTKRGSGCSLINLTYFWIFLSRHVSFFVIRLEFNIGVEKKQRSYKAEIQYIILSCLFSCQCFGSEGKSLSLNRQTDRKKLKSFVRGSI